MWILLAALQQAGLSHTNSLPSPGPQLEVYFSFAISRLWPSFYGKKHKKFLEYMASEPCSFSFVA